MNQINDKSISNSFTLEDALGKEISKGKALLSIQSDQSNDVTNEKYQKFPQDVQEDILDFIRGQHGLKITYDSFSIHASKNGLCSSIASKSSLI